MEKLTPQQKFKLKVKEKIRLSNEREKMGLEPDPWVVNYRIKNNIIKSNWKSKQPKREPKKKVANSGSFKKGLIPYNKLSEEEKLISIEKSRLRTRQWHKDNKEKVNQYRKNKRNNNPEFKILSNLRKRLSFLLRKQINSKTQQTIKYIGCSIEDIMIHLKNKYKEGMSFENYGEWHIDHILPCYSFDLSKEENLYKCFNYENLQPLWAKENREKSNKILN